MTEPAAHTAPPQPIDERETDPLPTLGQVALKWLKRTIVLALAASVLVHIIGWLISALIVFDGPRGGSTAGSGEIEMAVMTESELSEMVSSPLDVQTPLVPDQVNPTPEVAELLDAAPGDELASSSLELSDLGPVVGGGDISEGGEGLGGSGGGGASFFGVEAQGNRFAYIVDVSGSMEGARLQTLQLELIRSIEQLLSTSEFIVVPYSSDAAPMAGRKSWTDASTSGKGWAKNAVTGLRAEGGTDPRPGFALVFEMKPIPDAIYFMTDGEFDDVVPDEVSSRNRRYKIPVHCIYIGDSEPVPEIEKKMRMIARQSRGTYRFIKGP